MVAERIISYNSGSCTEGEVPRMVIFKKIDKAARWSATSAGALGSVALACLAGTAGLLVGKYIKEKLQASIK